MTTAIAPAAQTRAAAGDGALLGRRPGGGRRGHRGARRGRRSPTCWPGPQAAHAGLGPVLQVATVLLDGRPAPGVSRLTEGATLEVLPPFAGG